MKTFSKLTFVLALAATLTACQGKDTYTPSYPPGEPDAQTPDVILTAAAAPEVPGIQIFELGGTGLRVPVHGQAYRYFFEAVVTLPDGAVFRSTDPDWSQSFEWNTTCKELLSTGEGYYELDASVSGTYAVTCTFDQAMTASTSVQVFEPTYKFLSFEGTRTEGPAYDNLGVSVTIGVTDPSDGRTIDTITRDCPYLNGIDVGNLSVMIAYDCVEGGLWSGSGDTVAHGTAARYYVHVKDGGNHWDTYGPTSL